MPEIEFTDTEVLIKMPKTLLVLTKAQFIEALRLGKAYLRSTRPRARVAKARGEGDGDSH
jgi:hypothetical protein